ncbi:hypothetical protein NL64_06445 [Pseudomonas fluorescens]|uniref:hypothetical protein n=1 Tax=Pseudomonas fluorescens TaxID=294 RepID=UPI00054B2743|nr:hypothetical protein [Pseudomonas fluorescens]KII34893.1 hypothetical protein NL64_06445 [Pseudomonas fluorescens]
MNDLTLNTENATEIDTDATTTAVVLAPSDRLLLAAKLVSKSLAKVMLLDEQLADQTIAVSTAKQRVTETLANGGTGFDEAGRVFKAANNKLDKLLESREAVVRTAQLDLDATRDSIAGVQALLHSLEA